MTTAASEIKSGARFGFGRNWRNFNASASPAAVSGAVESLRALLGVDELAGKTFLDAGSGSGLFSAAAHSLGATVSSFDFDPESVTCTQQRRDDIGADDSDWTVSTGSVLDDHFLAGLGVFDVVYCWGVAHHTGDMWSALQNLAERVRPGGLLVVAIYNDQGTPSRRWLHIKKLYNKYPLLRPLLLAGSFVRLWGVRSLKDMLRGRPFYSWRNYAVGYRGMSAWHDLVDWVGGYPFQVAKPEEIFEFYKARDFQLEKLTTGAGGIGCNQYVFCRR
jgi:2-polyprenyl-6-hydroxyphenyl methylase/3-demethylubiquinone-9 3-methyltransferase